jgi:hypothetical protein
MYAATEMGPVVVIAWPRNCASGVDHCRSPSFGAGGVAGGVGGLEGADVEERRSGRCAGRAVSKAGRGRLHRVAVRSRLRDWALMAVAGEEGP